MNSQTYGQKKDIELNIKDLIWNLLTQWKAILLVSLLMAMLICGVKYLGDVRAYKAETAKISEAEAQASLSNEDRIAAILSALPDSDREAVLMVLREQEWLDEQRSYMKESILMNIDPANLRALKLIFDIDAENASDVPVLHQDYALFIGSKHFRNEIGKAFDSDAQDKYIGELINTWNAVGPETDMGQTGSVLFVQIVLPADADADAVAVAAEKAVKTYSKGIQDKYAHKITLANRDLSIIYSYDIVNRFNDTFYKINSMNNTVIGAINSMTDEQKDAFDAILAIRTGVEDVQLDNTAGDSELTAPEYSMKYAFLGFILGLFLYAFIYVILLIMKRQVNSAANVQSYTGSRLIGEVYCDSDKKGLKKLFHSKIIDKYYHRGKTDQITQIEKVADSIEAVCKHAGINKLALFDMTGSSSSSETNDKLKGVIKSIMNAATDRGLEVDIVDVYDSDYFCEKKMIDIDNSVIAVSSDTKINSLNRILSLCSDYSVNTMGGVYTAEL
jgi:hypothetical protein